MREPPFKSIPKVLQNPVYGLMSEARLQEFLRQVHLIYLVTKKVTHFLRCSRILFFNAHAPDKTRRADYITWQLEPCSIGKEQTLYPKLARAWDIAFVICHNARYAGLPCNIIVSALFQTNRPHARTKDAWEH